MAPGTDRLNIALADCYRIERELGRGGMATVYLAQDLKHDRKVALKVLRPELAAVLGAERFLREITTTANLRHPHILPLYDSGEAAGFLFYVMPFVEGETLRDRLTRERQLPYDDALQIAREVADALSYAHGRGVIHRDIKPENILLESGHAVVADFGIARAVDAAGGTQLTETGLAIGTPTYMSPEQSAAEPLDSRSDLYSLGSVLYEMLAGEPPYSGPTAHAVFAKRLMEPVPRVTTLRESVPPAVEQALLRALAKAPADRFTTVHEFARSLDPSVAAPALAAAPATPSRSRATLAVGAIGMVAVAVLTLLYLRDRRANWVREVAIPTIERLVEADQLDSAFALAFDAAKRAPDDSTLDALWGRISQTQTFLSEPAGAEVTRASLDDTTRWIPVGTTPTPPVRIPNNAWFYRYEKAGYRTVTVMGARLGGSYVPIPSPIPLRRLSDPDTNMVLLRGARLVGTLYGLSVSDTFDLSDFLMDTHEVTNRQYKAFVDAGGYTDRAWWDSTIVRDGRAMAWEAAIVLFVDRTGRPGPASWEGGAPPRETDDLPVGGVSWYEAHAYARYAQKDLPTVHEWNAAAIPEAARWVVPHGRYEAAGPMPGGEPRGVSPRGVYDMAGNVREWTVNAREPGSRYILGGGWSDPPYLFSEIYTQPEFDRSAINGIRLVRRVGASEDLARASAPIPGLTRDYATARPVDDATYRGFLAMYDYDRTPLNANMISRDSSHADWIREDIEFDLPGAARMPAVLFLPKRVEPPFQTIVLWPASDALLLRDPRRLSMSFVDYFVRSGRALLYPIYEHTYGRGTWIGADRLDGTIAHRDQMLRWAREMQRSIDYVSTRPDIDTTRLAFAGTSWGGRLAGVMLAIEPRFRAAVLNVPGLSMAPMRPEEDPVNFLPRVKIPVLMLSGKYDSVFPYELSQTPFAQLLGSPPGLKKQVVFEGGHFLPRPMMVRESLNWLDQYLGPVAGRP